LESSNVMEVVTLNEIGNHGSGLVKGYSLSHVIDLVGAREGGLEDGAGDGALRRWGMGSTRDSTTTTSQPTIRHLAMMEPNPIRTSVRITTITAQCNLLRLPTHATVGLLMFPVFNLQNKINPPEPLVL